ncbi:armadillo-type protein [Roridomyces roridus]|uniref:Armadillo-type protein n=1 Tax=Roridomyces roridus TaxID=1738132 RepID=A0AAD7B805_9AGAR|nr:armadillo-type protein [Roridomyces roridus]
MAGFEIGAQGILNSSTFSEILPLLGSSNRGMRQETARLIGDLTSHRSVGQPNNGWNQVVEKLELALRQATVELLASTHPELAIGAARLIGTIAEHHSDAATMTTMIKKLNFSFDRIVVLLHHDDTRVEREGLSALCKIAYSNLTAQLIMDTTALESVVKLLNSPDHMVRLESCRLIAKLSSHEDELSQLLAADPLPKLVQLLRPRDARRLTNEALEALCQIASWELGAKAILSTPAAEDTILHLELVDAEIIYWRAVLLGKLLKHRLKLREEISN